MNLKNANKKLECGSLNGSQLLLQPLAVLQVLLHVPSADGAGVMATGLPPVEAGGVEHLVLAGKDNVS